MKERSLGLPAPPGGQQRQASPGVAWLGSFCTLRWPGHPGWGWRWCKEPTTNCFLGFQCEEGAGRESLLAARSPSSNPKRHHFHFGLQPKVHPRPGGLSQPRRDLRVLSGGSWGARQPWYPPATARLAADAALTPFDAGWCFRKELRASRQI